jgi:hypothetical protein
MIESYNGWWQDKVWSRFEHQDLEHLQERSRKYVAAVRRQRASRIEAAPSRRQFPDDWKLNLKKRPQGQVIYVRRTNPNSEVIVMGKTWPLGVIWPNRLVRCEVDLTQDKICFFTLRRKEPTHQPMVLEVDYRLPNRGFDD